MNKKMLSRLLWQKLIIWPLVQSVFPPDHWGRRRVELRDWPWLVIGYGRNTLTVRNTVTGHQLALPFDSIRGHQSNVGQRPPFLMLKAQVWITAIDAGLWPAPQWAV